MPECHNCPHNGAADPACLTCKGPPETNHKGKTFVSFNAKEDGAEQGAAEVEAALLAFEEEPDDADPDEDGDADPAAPDPDEGGCGVDLPPCCEDSGRRLLAFIFSLNAVDFSLLSHKVNGVGHSAWAKSQGVSKQRACQRFNAIVKRHPEIGAMFPRR